MVRIWIDFIVKLRLVSCYGGVDLNVFGFVSDSDVEHLQLGLY